MRKSIQVAEMFPELLQQGSAVGNALSLVACPGLITGIARIGTILSNQLAAHAATNLIFYFAACLSSPAMAKIVYPMSFAICRACSRFFSA
jgi:hypothetical protein